MPASVVIISAILICESNMRTNAIEITTADSFANLAFMIGYTLTAIDNEVFKGGIYYRCEEI
jgi:hypothetical protein